MATKINRGAVVLLLYLALLRAGTAQTQWAKDFGAGRDALRARLVDWNDDGLLDVVVNTGTSIEVFNGADGSRRWRLDPAMPGTNSSLSGPFGLRPASFGRTIPADVDGDGLPDLVVVAYRYDVSDEYSLQVSNCIQVYDLGNGQLKWQKDGILTAFEPLTLSIGNLDADRPLEAVFFSAGYDLESELYTNRMLTVLDLASGALQWATNFGSGPERLRVTALIDWENDGMLDVCVKTVDSIRIFDGADGTLKWVLAPTLPAADWEISGFVGLKKADLGRWTFADLTGDGAPDIALVLRQYLGDGQSAERLDVYDIASKALRWHTTTAQGSVGFGARNVDGDSPYEFAAVTWGHDSSNDLFTNRVLTILDGANGAVQWTHAFGDGPEPLAPQFWDWDKDGTMDLVMRTESTIDVFNGADGTLKWQMTLNRPGPKWRAFGPYPASEQALNIIGPADLDGDGQPDFMLTWLETGAAQASAVIQIYDLNRKTLKWQTELRDFAGIIPSVGNIDPDPAQELVLVSSAFNESSGDFPNRVLTVLDASGLPPVLNGPTRDGNSFGFAFPTVAGKQYILEFKETLEAASWRPVSQVIGDGFVKKITDPSATASQRFYRLRVD